MYNDCVLSTLLYESESWTTYAAQERKLNVFNIRSLRKLFGISWTNRTPKTAKTVVLSRCELPTTFMMFCQRRLRWLGQVKHIKDGRMPNNMLYGEFIAGKRNLGVSNYAIKMCESGTLKS